MKKLLTLCLAISISLSLFGQNKTIEKAARYMKNDNFEKALPILNQYILDDSTNSAEAYILRAKCFRRLGYYYNANNDLERALQIDGRNARIFCEMGTIHSINKRYEMAFKYFNRAVLLNPELAEPHICMGAAYYMMDSLDRAIMEYGIAIALEPQNLFPYLNRGLAYSFIEENEKAIADFTQFLKQKSRRYRGYYFRGQCYYAIDEYQKAIDDFTKAIKYFNNSDPYEKVDITKLYNERAKCYLALGQIRKYKRDIRRVEK